MNVIDIINSWKKSFNPTDKQKALADERMNICNECPHKKQMLSIDVCGECGCPLAKKVYSRYGCPLDKW